MKKQDAIELLREIYAANERIWIDDDGYVTDEAPGWFSLLHHGLHPCGLGKRPMTKEAKMGWKTVQKVRAAIAKAEGRE